MVANVSLSSQNPLGANHYIQAALVEEPLHGGSEKWLMLAHDLRNPLMAMQRVIEIAITESGSDNTRNMLAQAYTNCDLLLDMLTGVLDSHRAQSSVTAIGGKKTSPAVIVDKCMRLVRSSIAEKGISLRSHILPGLPNVAGDEWSIIRVLTNLIQNAVKASPVGGVIEVSIEGDSNDCVVFSVKDYGSGIPAREADRIFDMMFQCAESRGSSGYGWGLYYCKTTLETLGGEIWVESSEGGPDKGTVISFTVPAC